jgi:hypothetical protein
MTFRKLQNFCSKFAPSCCWLLCIRNWVGQLVVQPCVPWRIFGTRKSDEKGLDMD